MGYKNDQFAGLGANERAYARGGDARVRGRRVTTNSDFGGLRPFPDNKVRSTYRDSDGNLQFQNTVLKKGYIRSLLTKVQTSGTEASNLPVLRCDFQFNPDRLVQTVPMRTNLVNVFQQSPAQFTQPLPGDVSFGFNLVFDRTYTYNNSSDDQVDPDLQGSYNEKNIGVLHDLRILYSIIGQGISKDFVDASVNAAVGQARQVAATELIDASNEEDQNFALSTEFGAAAGDFFNSNIGNSAFLIPTPVRVVFSGLYVVDGYITSATTTFTKFSSSYVPIQCSVGLTMQALYIGFANDRSFVVENLENATKELEQSLAAARALRQDTADAFINAAPKLEITFKTDGVDKGLDSWKQIDGESSYAGDNSIGYFLFTPDIPEFEPPLVSDTLTRIMNIKGYALTNVSPGTSAQTPIPGAPSGDQITAIFSNTETTPPTIQVVVDAKFYGPLNETPVSWLALSDDIKENSLISEAYSSFNITSLEQWETFKKGTTASWVYTQRNEAVTRQYLNSLRLSNVNTKFMIKVSAYISVSIAGGSPVKYEYADVWVNQNSGVTQFDRSVSIQTNKPL